MSQPQRPCQPSPPLERFGTVIETEDDVRQALQSGLKGRSPGPAVHAELSPVPAREHSEKVG